MANKKEKSIWVYIADDIATNYPDFGHPSEWEDEDIERFRKIMRRKLLEVCDTHPSLARQITRKYDPQKSNDKQLEAPSIKTFKRKFKEGDRSGAPSVKLAFTALFNFADYIDYMNSRDIPVSEAIDNETSLQDKIRTYNKYQLGYVRSFHKSYNVNQIFIKPTLRDRFNKKWSPNLNRILEQNDRITIHSDSFTGKTTLLKHLALEAPDDLIVLYLPLSEYTGSITNLVQKKYDISEEKATELTFHNKDVILLLDAVDEIANAEWRDHLMNVELYSGNIFRYIITSRSQFIANMTLDSTLELKIESYDIRAVYLLVDKIIDDTSLVIDFHSGLNYGNKINKELEILKYPWLVIFVMEHFLDGNVLDNEFYLTLPLEIFDALIQTLRNKRLFGQSEELEEAFNVGQFIFDRMHDRDTAIEIIYEGDFDVNTISFLEELAHFGILNIPGIIGANTRKFRFTIPILDQTFAAYYLSLLSPHILEKILSSIYYNKNFRLILSLTAAIKAKRGEDILIFLDSKKHAPIKKKCYGNYEFLFPLSILTFLPKGTFYKKQLKSESIDFSTDTVPDTPSPNIWLTFYFKYIKSFIKSKIKNESTDFVDTKDQKTVLQIIKDELDQFYHEKLMRFLPYLIEKDEGWAEQFWAFCEAQPIDKLGLGFENLIAKARSNCVRTAAFKEKFSELLQTSPYLLHGYLKSLMQSPYRTPDLYDRLWSKFLPDIDEHYYNLEPNLSPIEYNKRRVDSWDDHNTLFLVCILLFKRGHFTSQNLEKLFFFLGKYHLEPDDQAYSKFQLGDFKSIWLTRQLGQLLFKQLKSGFHFYYFSPAFYIMDSKMLHSQEDLTSSDLMIQTIDLFLAKTKRIKEKLKDKDSLSSNDLYREDLWVDIRGFFLGYLSLAHLPKLKAKVEKLFCQFLDLNDLGFTLSRANFTIISIYLIYLESDTLIEKIKTNEFCNTTLLGWVEYQLKDKSYFHHITTSNEYINTLVALRRVIKWEEGYEYHEEITSIALELSKRSAQYEEPKSSKYKEHINKFFENDDWFELSLASTYDEFEEFLKENKDSKFVEYAIRHAIHNIKPLFIEQNEATGEIHYYYSDQGIHE